MLSERKALEGRTYTTIRAIKDLQLFSLLALRQ